MPRWITVLLPFIGLSSCFVAGSQPQSDPEPHARRRGDPHRHLNPRHPRRPLPRLQKGHRHRPRSRPGRLRCGGSHLHPPRPHIRRDRGGPYRPRERNRRRPAQPHRFRHRPVSGWGRHCGAAPSRGFGLRRAYPFTLRNPAAMPDGGSAHSRMRFRKPSSGMAQWLPFPARR